MYFFSLAIFGVNLRIPRMLISGGPFVAAAVMQTDGFEYLKESCPHVLTELLEYVARTNEHSIVISKQVNEAILDGSDINGRRVKQRL